MAKKFSMLKSIAVTAALVAGVSGLARADDNSMNPFTGDSYAYFNGGNLPQGDRPIFAKAPSSWHQAYPKGLTERQLQADSTEAPAFHDQATFFDTAPSSWRQSHPNGLSEGELQALSSEAPAWHSNQPATTALAATTGVVIAKSTVK
jgi:hypothetical protein